MSAAELCWKHGTSDATFYKWRSKFGGMEVSDARRLKDVPTENSIPTPLGVGVAWFWVELIDNISCAPFPVVASI